MRRIAIESKDLAKPILGKITRKPLSWWRRRDHILLVDAGDSARTRGYAAVLAHKGTPEGKLRAGRTRIVYGGENLGVVKDGDIVLLEPEERMASVLYEAESPHNVIFVTERCNCSCIMCPQPPKQQEDSRTAFNVRLIEMMAPGPDVLAMTGGEPTLLGDEFLALVEVCKRKLPKTHLAILTNGRLFRRRGFVEALAGIGHPNLMIAVPLYSDLDSVHDRIVGAKSAFEDTVVGLHNLALYGLPVELRTVVLPYNYLRLTQFCDFIYRNLPFVVHVAIMGLETTGMALRNLDSVWVDPHATAPQLVAACEYLGRRMVPVSLYNHQLCVIPRRLWPLARRSISGWKNIYLPECDGCAVKDECCGFFESATAKHSDQIKPVKNVLDR